MNSVVHLLPWVDGVIAFALVEAVVLWLVLRGSRRGVAPASYAWNLASGLCLMLALRGALAGAGVAWLGLALLGAGVCHGVDLWSRWPR